MGKINFRLNMSDNIPQFRRYLNDVISKYDKYSDTILSEICEQLVEDAQRNLLISGYDVYNLLDNITYQKYGENKYRVGIKNNEDKDIMYFLEFGTGIVGQDRPHPMADEVGWEYVVNPDNMVSNEKASGYNSVGDFVGGIGWWYEVDDPTKAHAYNRKTGRYYAFTSGLKSVKYLYDAIKPENIDRIVRQVLIKYRNME